MTPASKYKIVATHYIKQGSKLYLYQDGHLGSTASSWKSVDEFLASFYQDSLAGLAIANGDNRDIICTANKHVPAMKAERVAFRAKYPRQCNSGNHSGEPSQIGEVIIVHVTDKAGVVLYSIAVTHGDALADYDRWLKYRQKAHGAGWFKRTFIVNAIETFEKLHDRKIKQKLITAAQDMCDELKVSKIIIGHFHHDELVQLGQQCTLQLMGRGRRVMVA